MFRKCKPFLFNTKFDNISVSKLISVICNDDLPIPNAFLNLLFSRLTLSIELSLKNTKWISEKFSKASATLEIAPLYAVLMLPNH